MEDLKASNITIVEDMGRKYLGSIEQLMKLGSLHDARNLPKRDEKGKLIKQKKGWTPAKPLMPTTPELQQEVEKLMVWFGSHLRPHTQHIIRLILESQIFENRMKGKTS